MSSEIQWVARLRVEKGGGNVDQADNDSTHNMQTTLVRMSGLLQTLTANTRTAPNYGTVDTSVAGGHIVLITNRGSANFVKVEVQTAATPTYLEIGRMYPGESFGPVRLLPPASGVGSIHLTADTAGSNVQVTAVEAGNPNT
jgi:hypothetical protein